MYSCDVVFLKQINLMMIMFFTVFTLMPGSTLVLKKALHLNMVATMFIVNLLHPLDFLLSILIFQFRRNSGLSLMVTETVIPVCIIFLYVRL